MEGSTIASLTATEEIIVAPESGEISAIKRTETLEFLPAAMGGLCCPVCGGDLRHDEREGVPVDACSQCRGIWLDEGELDKIIARTYIAYINAITIERSKHV